MADKISVEDLWVVADFGYYGEPSCDGYIYHSKEDAKQVADEANRQYPNLNKRVMDLQDFIWENRSWHHEEQGY